MSDRSKRGLRPGSGPVWRVARRFTQAIIPLALLVSPLLGGWQRLGRNDMAAWDGHGWDLPARLLDRLPETQARAAYDAIYLSGGGTAVDWFGLGIVDPLGGAVALLAGADFASRTLIAWLLAVGVALVAGRVFCGWFCPFGTLSRGLEFVLERLPWQLPRYSPPARRSLRFGLLGVGLVLGALGFPLALYLLLPHLLVQQAGYGLWLMGGVGAAFGALVGLAVVGMFFGPTTYCATVCPTGAALALTGRKRLVRLTIVQPDDCGPHCNLCDEACWLTLHPSTGDPGPDCDSCGRCTEVCPHDNLSVNLTGKIRRRVRSVAAAIVLALLPASALAAPAPQDPRRPTLLLESTRQVAGVDVVVSLVDLRGIELDANDGRQLEEVELSVYLARGEAEPPDRIGRQQPRDVYDGPLEVELVAADGTTQRMRWDTPNYPTSTPNRSIYRERIRWEPSVGDRVVVFPVQGWLDEPVEWTAPAVRPDGTWRTVGYGLGTGLLFAGLISLALLGPFRKPQRS